MHGCSSNFNMHKDSYNKLLRKVIFKMHGGIKTGAPKAGTNYYSMRMGPRLRVNEDK